METQDNSGFEGTISVQLANDQTLDQFCAAHISDYHAGRYEAVSVKIVVGTAAAITVYATDKMHPATAQGKIPVKEFKLAILYLDELLSYCGGFSTALMKSNIAFENIEIIND